MPIGNNFALIYKKNVQVLKIWLATNPADSDKNKQSQPFAAKSEQLPKKSNT